MEWARTFSELPKQFINTVSTKMASTVETVSAASEEHLGAFLGDHFKDTLLLRYFGLTKIPLLFAVSPKVVAFSEDQCSVRVPLTRITKNHLGSMYFGALSIGADCTAALHAMHFIEQSEKKVALIFKDFHADFLKRAESDVIFTCNEGAIIKDLVAQAVAKGERVSAPIDIVATLANAPEEQVAKFVLTLSLKVKP